jgi:molecular chaperone DnaK
VGIPPAPKGVPQIEVTFEIDSNGILEVRAVDRQSKKQQAIRVSPSGGLTEDEIQRIIEDASTHAQEDERRAELSRMRSRLEGLLATSSRTFQEFGKMLPDSDQETVQGALQLAKTAVETNNPAELTAALGQLEEVGKILTTVMLYDVNQFGAGTPDRKK